MPGFGRVWHLPLVAAGWLRGGGCCWLAPGAVRLRRWGLWYGRGGEAVRASGAVHGFPAADECHRPGRAGARAGGLGCAVSASDGAGGSGKIGLAGGKPRGGGRAGSRAGCGWWDRRTRLGWAGVDAGREGRGRARGMPGRPPGAGDLGGPGVTWGGVAG